MSLIPQLSKTLRAFDKAFERDLQRLPMFQQLTDPFGITAQSLQQPKIDMYETEKEFKIEAECPGIPKDKISLEIQGNDSLVLSSHYQKEHKDKLVWERESGSFKRVIGFPGPIKEDGVSATFKDGVLYVSVPKSTEAKGKPIEIKEESMQ
jgi:HSP20 family protein